MAEALEESLGICGDDPDIIEAKKRLLESKVLSPSHFDVGEDNVNCSFDSEGYDFSENDGARGNGTTPHRPNSDHQGGKEEEKSENSNTDNDDGQVPTETTPLRPSIFTAVASLAEREKKDDKDDPDERRQKLE